MVIHAHNYLEVIRAKDSYKTHYRYVSLGPGSAVGEKGKDK